MAAIRTMALIIFTAICLLGCGFMLYVLVQWMRDTGRKAAGRRQDSQTRIHRKPYILATVFNREKTLLDPVLRPIKKLVGSGIIGQTFTGPGYFHSRPSNAGTGYDATSSSASNLGPTNKALIGRVKGDVQKAQAENPSAPVPIDLVTSSGSGLDPDISPAAAEFQISRVARERHMNPDDVRALIQLHTRGRQLGFLGEPRVNVLKLNLDLDAAHPIR